MTDSPAGSITGYIRADSRSFRNGQFSPINATYAAFRPSDECPDGARQAYLPPLADGEFFQVRGDIDMSEGRGGTRAIRNYLVYQDAYRASFGKGAQGGIGEVWIMSPMEPSQIVAVDANGEETVMAVIPQFRMSSIASRLVFAEPIRS
jgi:hypothetical protein